MNFFIEYTHNYEWEIKINGEFIQRVSEKEAAIDICKNLGRALDTGDNDIEIKEGK
jgi:hypothetical protein